MRLVIVALLRELLKHPWQLALTLFSIAAGVAIVVGVDIANRSAMREFERANATVDGLATHRVVGGEQGLEQDIYRLVKVDARIQNAAPVVTATVAVAGREGRYTLLGIDPLSDFRIRELQLRGNDDVSGADSGASVISERDWTLYAGSGINRQSNDDVTLLQGTRSQVFEVAGTLGVGSGGEADMSSILVTDLIWAQSFLGMRGRLSHIALRLQPDEVETLRASLPVSVRLIDVDTYNSARAEMTRAFRTNLTALSLLALVIAMFLVYSTISFQIVRRTSLFAQLRATGVSGLQLAVVLILEILFIALIGTLFGLVMGALLAAGLNALITQTINALYFALAAPGYTLPAWTLAKGLLIGIAATLAASAIPIAQVARSSVRGLLARSNQERAIARLAAWSPLIALALGLSGAFLMLLPIQSIVTAFAGLFMVILALAVLAPWTINGVGSVARRWQLAPAKGRRSGRALGLGIKMAILNMRAHLSRTAVAVAALTVAVSATLGVGLMIDSFRFSVERWMESYLRADIYITSESTGDSSLPPAFRQALRSLEGVRGVSLGTRRTLAVEGEPLILFALDTTPEGFAGFQTIDKVSGDLWTRYHQNGEVLITEPLSRRLDLDAGDSMTIPTREGRREFRIAAVYTDYSSDRGLVSMDWATYSRYFDSIRVASAALYLDSGVDVGAVMEQVRLLEDAPPALYLRSNKGLRDASLEVFDQTFRITDVLRWLAMIVAVVGIVSALMALQLERAREYAVLKAIGFSRLQLVGQMLLETGLTGLWAGLLAVPMGFVLAIALINVINVRSFGWSMATVVDWSLVGQSLMLSIIAAALAGVYPAWRLWRADIASGLRDE